ncbi:MAG: methyltransferase domain-containing protein [Bacteroidia bacterium]|nr:MAG: methyltransferase domain-containing protein [Bacteroidia bacterium]
MANQHFDFKQFRVTQKQAVFKVGTDGVLLGAWARTFDMGDALDIGTGTGLLALMVAQRSPMSVDAIEPDKQSADEASENVKVSRWSKRVTVLNTSLQDYAAETGKKYDLIITNPPFFIDSVLNIDKRLSGTRHNVTLGADDILVSVSKLLKESGRLSLILPYTEGNIFIAMASAYGLYCNRLTRVKPIPSKPVRRLLLEFSRFKEVLISDYLTIERGNRHEYSPEYIALTRDFYLDF